MKKKILRYRLPDWIAPYVINGDASGLNDQEIAEIDNFIKKERIYILEKLDDSSFYHNNDLNNLGNNCSTYTAHRLPRNRTIDKIITTVNCTYGAPMGRPNIGKQPVTITSGPKCKILKKNQIKVYDCYIPMAGGYDRGGAYWGLPDNVRVKYTKDLSYIEFYRPGN